MSRPLNGFDYLRNLTTLAVILLHVSATYIVTYNASPSEWFIANIFNNITRWSVPVFFMLSGAFLLDPKRNESLSFFFKKRLTKLVVPLFVWSIFYYIFSSYQNGLNISFSNFLISLYTNTTYYHLWFLYTLIGIYILVPLLRSCLPHLSNTLLRYGFILWFLCTTLTSFINYFFDYESYFTSPIMGYIGYFILGYYLRTMHIKKSNLTWIYLSGIVAVIISIFGTFFFTKNNDGIISNLFISNYSFTTAISAIAIFLAFKHFNPKRTSKINQSISNNSFGIYLIHVFVLSIFIKHTIIPFNDHLIIQIPLLTLCTFSISFIISYIISKIPGINKTIN